MKKYIKILLLSLVLFLFSSCDNLKFGRSKNYYREYTSHPCYDCGYQICSCGRYHTYRHNKGILYNKQIYKPIYHKKLQIPKRKRSTLNMGKSRINKTSDRIRKGK